MSAAPVAELSLKPLQFLMNPYQFFLFPTLAALFLALGGVISAETSASPTSVVLVVASTDGASAMEILDNAIAALAPERLAWVETKVWQQARCDEFVYQALGRFVRGPGERTRFDLNIQVGSTLTESRSVCDGASLWTSVRIGNGEAEKREQRLPAAGESSGTEAVQSRLRFLSERGSGGPEGALRSMRQALSTAQVRRERWQGHEVLVVSGNFKCDTQTWAAQPENLRARFQVRQCRAYLDAITGWPHRIEWWGSESPGGACELISQTEYRDPIFNQPMSMERCVAEFTFAN